MLYVRACVYVLRMISPDKILNFKKPGLYSGGGGGGVIITRTGKPNFEAAKRLRPHSLHTIHTTACSAVVVAARSKHPRFSEGPV